MSGRRLIPLCAGNPDIIAWLHEHDLDPLQVSMNPDQRPLITGDVMTIHLYAVDDEGNRYLDRERAEAVVQRRTVALKRQPPDLRDTNGSPFPATEPA